MSPRDRDASGRPRNARPRDVTGRPLPRGSEGAAPLAEAPAPAPAAAVTAADRLLAAGRPFPAHEVLEAAWKDARADPRRSGEVGFWRATAQLAVGLTHLQRGNAPGASSLLRRAEAGLAAYAGTPLYGVDPQRLAATAHQLAARLDADGPAAAAAAARAVRLRPGAGG